jgi:hypothetical protein
MVGVSQTCQKKKKQISHSIAFHKHSILKYHYS